jgi:putative ABC transport system permease protein
MTAPRLILAEIRHRKLNFLLSAVAVAVAVAAILGVQIVIAAHNLETRRLLDARRAEIEQRGAVLQDDMRKITKGLGFNVLILPAGQDLANVYAEGYAEKTMPEKYADLLAGVPSIRTIQHLLPALERKIVWPEQKRTVILIGIRGEVPFVGQEELKPLLDPVKPGEMIVGFELHKSLGLKAGDQVALMGRAFRIAKTYPERGTKDDITMWITLKEAQELQGKPGQINAIWALNCNCFSADRLAEVRAEISRALPDTQVIEIAGQATARAEARKRAYDDAVMAMEAEAAGRQDWQHQMEAFAAVLFPVVAVAACLWVGILAWINVRDRRSEIAILRAVGVRSGKILTVFLGRAALLGLVGSLAGVGAGFLAGWRAAASVLPAGQVHGALLASPELAACTGAVLAGAVLVSVAACWLPAQHARQMDPAVLLRNG